MMGIRNQLHGLTLLLVILSSYVSAEHYYIVPNNSSSQCQRYSAGACFTLAEFASNMYSSYLDLTLNFLPGEHLLTRRLTITGLNNIELTRQKSSNSLSTIKCQGTSGFEFRDIQSLNISYLEFTGCGNVSCGGAVSISNADLIIRGCKFTGNYVTGDYSYGGAIAIKEVNNLLIRDSHFTANRVIGDESYGGAVFNRAVDNVVIRGCKFTDNHVIGDYSYGGATAVINEVNNFLISGSHFTANYVIGRFSYGGAIHAADMKIEDSFFDDNYAAGGLNEGGAIFVGYGNFYSTNNHYTNNSADGDGGAIYVSGHISSTSDNYIHNNAGSGGAISVYSTFAKIYSTSASNNYTNNSAVYHGGAIYVHAGNVYSTSDNYINNHADLYGGAIYVLDSNVNSTSNMYINNSADSDGAAIHVESKSGNIYSTSDHYINNSAVRDGGAIGVYSGGTLYSTSNVYLTNRANGNGGAILINSDSDSKINGDNFEQNSAVEGAAIHKTAGALEIVQSNITGNFASGKGTVYTNSGSLSFFARVNFMDNQGSLYVFNSQIEFNTSVVVFENNFGDSGGAITAFLSQISFNKLSTITISNNTATHGGGIFLTQSNLHVYHSIKLTHNHATDFGGGIYAYQSKIEFKPEQTLTSEITSNTASNGGAICVIASNMQITNTNMDIFSNSAKVNGGAIYLEQNSKIYIQKHVIEQDLYLDFINNFAVKGGAIYVADNTNDGVICQEANTEIYQTECFIQTLQLYQDASYVSGLSLINTFFSNNIADQSGSDIYGGLLDRCAINQNAEIVRYFPEYKNRSGVDYVMATTNTRLGQISSDAVRVEFCLNNVISPKYNHPNVSIKKGEMFTISLVAVDQVGNPLNATIINSFQSKSGNGQLGVGQVEQQVVNQCTELEYNVYSQDNSAQIHIYADGPCTNKGVSLKTLNIVFLPCICPIRFHPSQSDKDCICECDQNSLVFCSDNVSSPNNSYTNVTKKKGEMFTISVVAVDQTGNPVNATIISSFSSESGKGHLKDSQVVQQVGNQCTQLEYNVYSLDNSAQIHINLYTDTPCGNRVATRTLNVIFLPCTCPAGFHPSPSENDCICECGQSSLLFCSDSLEFLNYSYPNVSIKKGEVFTVSIVAVDHDGYAVNSTIISSFSSESGKGHLKDSQVVQQVGNQCTELEYNVYSLDNSAQIHINLYTDTPCGNRVSTKTLNLNFLPCICPVGFQVSQSENDCICECDQRLKQHQITTCSAENETILVETNTWIGFGDYTLNETELIIQDCPFDYCVQEPVHVNLSSIDEQCAYNRTGILCGMCQEDLSLVFGSSRCRECSNNYISLLIPFALAGIALVAFILLLNMTVAAGTIHGLIFYANILKANYSLFLPPSTSNFLTVFISWLNLDTGIETCFYNGMDSYGKFLFQLAFPTYVFVLIGTIIVLCEVSNKFATLLGNRNPVAALCTLILLSYSKLIRTIITALQFTYLDYADGPSEIVWQYDANVHYFTVSHIPRFIAAFIITILGAIYTILLLFGQWFPRCSKRKIMKWTKNTKYNAFIDAYHAPFTPKHRYWMGLLLFAQITLNIVAAMATDSLVAILSAGCVSLGLILLRVINTRIYKNRLLDSLETLLLINIVMLAIGTFYIREANEDQLLTHHIIETNEGQLALANTSMAISFILFVIIFGYHFYKYILKGTQVWDRVTQLLKRILQPHDRHRDFNMVPLEDEDEDDEQDEQMIELQPPYTDDNDTDSVNLPHHYDPPVIVPAVRYDQPREPDLDILDPITTDDYRQLNQPPAPRPRQVPTSTVIDFVPPRLNVDHLDQS